MPDSKELERLVESLSVCYDDIVAVAKEMDKHLQDLEYAIEAYVHEAEEELEDALND